MAQRTDLYSILVSYANKNNSPYIGIKTFLDFLERYAKKVSAGQPEWSKWSQDTAAKFWPEMSALIEDDKCQLLADTEEGRIYMPHFYIDLIGRAYQKADDDADLPFPSGDSLRITLPENQVRPLGCEYDLLTFLDDPPEDSIPIIKINFPGDFGSALVLPDDMPRKLTETAVLKVRNYLRRHGNKEYALRKLAPQLQGREQGLKEQLNRVLMRPMDCYPAIESGGEFSYLFWAHFCVLVKNDLRKKKEHLPEDIAAYQSVQIIDVVNGYFKSYTAKKREAELAFKSLENHLAKPPYVFTIDEIIKFTTPKGVLLLSQYSDTELEEWLKAKTTESADNGLPPLLVVREGSKGGRCYLLKDKMMTYCLQLLAAARGQVRDALSSHWHKLLMDFQKEPAMTGDLDFNKALAGLTRKLCPSLQALLDDPKLLLVYEEMGKSEAGIPAPVKIFDRGELVPFSELLLIRRKETLMDAKLMLPFWYSIPVLSAIIAFFKKLPRKKKAPRLPADSGGGEPGGKDRAGEIRAAAGEIEFALVPPGHTLDSYLGELENRWSRLIDRKAREDLTEDVQSLIRDQLRWYLRVHKKAEFTGETVKQMASDIVVRTPVLASMSGRDSLILYAEIYLVKLLKNVR